MHWSFSSLGCPELSLPDVCALAADFQIPALELRSLCNRTDLPACTAEPGFDPAKAATLLRRHSLQIVVAASSFKLVGNDETSRADFLRFCDWADSWNVPYVRVFGGGSWVSHAPPSNAPTPH